MVEARTPYIISVGRQAKEAKIIDIAIQGDAREKDKECKQLRSINFFIKKQGNCRS